MSEIAISLRNGVYHYLQGSVLGFSEQTEPTGYIEG